MQRPRFSAFAVSCALHAAATAITIVITSGKPESRNPSPDLAPFEPPLMVWLPSPGPRAGGGGSGNDNPDPPRGAELKGTDTMTMPTAPTPAPDAADTPEAQPTRTLNVPAQTFAASDLDAMGFIEAGADSLSQGPGSGGAAGSGVGLGIGPGIGSGLGPGNGGNTGGGSYRPGSGVTLPVALHREQPKYTVAAMRARIQGEVIVECVVQPHGECTNVRVLRSLDARLGLDDQALRAAAAWRFSPGTLLGKPVPVLVTIQLGFAIH